MSSSSWASCIIQMSPKTQRPRLYSPKLARLTLYSVTIEIGRHKLYLSMLLGSYVPLDAPMTVAFSTVDLWCLKGHPHFIPVRHQPKVLVPITLGNLAHGHHHESRPLITPTVLRQSALQALIRGKANPIPVLSTMMYWLARDGERKRLSRSWIIYEMNTRCLERCSY